MKIQKVKDMKTKMKFLPVALLIGMLAFTSCNNDDDNMDETVMSNTIADIAVANPDFSILVEALTRANLVDAVADKDAELTVFAPTNAAFVSLLSDLNLSSLHEVPNETLTSILLYHVIGSKAMSGDLESGYYPTLSTYNDNNMSVYIKVEDGVYLNKNTKVTTPREISGSKI